MDKVQWYMGEATFSIKINKKDEPNPYTIIKKSKK